MNSDVWISSHVTFWKGAAIWVFPYEAVAPSALVVFSCPCEGTGWLFERNRRSGYICWHTSQRDVSLFSLDCYFWTFSEWAKSFLMIFTGWWIKPAQSDSWALHCMCVMRSSGAVYSPRRAQLALSLEDSCRPLNPPWHLLPVSCVHSMLNPGLFSISFHA